MSSKRRRFRSRIQEEMRQNMRMRRKEYNRKVRRYPITEEQSVNELKGLRNLTWETMC